jgi:Undecaprenyl-phosphate glucose phosphotransferase
MRLSALPVRLLPDRAVSAVLAHDAAGPAESLLVQIQREPLSTAERTAKRTLDIVIACCTLLALAPLMVLTALAVKLESKGPIVFRQRRNGFNGKEFTVFKFRTMMVLEDGPSIVQAARGDRRVTRLGRLLRQTSIDELPQLFNVIKGNMSMVGPRPHAVAHDDEYGQLIANYAFRHHVKPGITGWAQVHGCRGATPHIENMAKRIELDLWYVNHWSLSLDLEILLRTIFELIRRRNAY